MCMVSMVYDSFKTIPIQQWTQPAWNDAQRILDAIRELDKKLGQKDCEDPKKAEWMREVEERLKKLEKAVEPKTGGTSAPQTTTSAHPNALKWYEDFLGWPDDELNKNQSQYREF